MNKRHIVMFFTICIAFIFTFTLFENTFAENNWVGGELRVDLPAIYTAKDYKVRIAATVLPSNTGTTDFTTGWLSINLTPDGVCTDGCFTQVGLMTMEDGIHWFAFTQYPYGITCWRGAPKWGIKGCLGAVGDLVSLNTWHTVELVTYPGVGYWIVRVYDTSGTPHDVAKITNDSTKIYRATVQFEEGYSEGISDPFYAGHYYFLEPEYKISGGFQEWPQTIIPIVDPYRANYIWPASNPQQSFCPSHYAARVNFSGYIYAWDAGTAGYGLTTCDWWLIPPVAISGTYDDALTNSIIYQRITDGDLYPGSWTHSTSYPYAYQGTMSYTNVINDRATFTFSGNRVTRLYTMSSNRGYASIYLDGVYQNTMYDNTSEIRRQVAKTWTFATGANHTIEVVNTGGGYIDIDAFIVNIPYVSSGSYDDPDGSYNYIGNWTHHCCSGRSYNQTRSWSHFLESAVSFTFFGNSVSYVFTKNNNRGIAAVTIDGVSKPDIDLYASSVQWQQQITFPNLGTGIHTIHIAVTGNKNPSSTDTYVDVDRFIVP